MLMSKILKAGMIGFVSIWLILCSWVFIASAGDATLSWDAPTTNTDGTPLTDLAGYKIYCSKTSGGYTLPCIDVKNVTTYKVINLTEGIWFFVATAYDTSGNESVYSNEVSKTIKVAPGCPLQLR